jgi:chemotaxis protein CheD
MAELKVGRQGDKLQALGLGSCVGVLLYDRQQHIGAMVHVMLPDSTVSKDASSQQGKFADTGVPLVLNEVLKAGALRNHLVVKIAGGAEMFSFAGSDAPRLAVGQRNIEAVHRHLNQLGLRISAEDVGGNAGRTFEIDLDTLVCTIKIIGKPEREL